MDTDRVVSIDSSNDFYWKPSTEFPLESLFLLFLRVDNFKKIAECQRNSLPRETPIKRSCKCITEQSTMNIVIVKCICV